MLQFLDEKVFTAYTLGLVLGLFIAYLLVKFIYVGFLILFFGFQDAVLSLFKNTEHKKPVETFFRKSNNLVGRLKWSDPEKDLWKDYDETVDDIYNNLVKGKQKSSS